MLCEEFLKLRKRLDTKCRWPVQSPAARCPLLCMRSLRACLLSASLTVGRLQTHILTVRLSGCQRSRSKPEAAFAVSLQAVKAAIEGGAVVL